MTSWQLIWRPVSINIKVSQFGQSVCMYFRTWWVIQLHSPNINIVIDRAFVLVVEYSVWIRRISFRMGKKKVQNIKPNFFWVSAHFLVLPNDLCSAYRHILIYMPAHIRRSHFFLFLVHLSFHKSKFGACAVLVWTEMVFRAPLDH